MNPNQVDVMDPNSYMDFADHPEDPYAKTGKIRVEFCMEAVQSETKSAKEGRPIYDEVEFIKISYPGNKNSVVYREVYPIDKQRFRSLYEAWKRGQEIAETGTPLEAWPYLSKSQIAELKHFNCRTVEDLAGMADTAVQRFMGLYKIRKAAQDFLAAAESTKHVTQIREEAEANAAQVRDLQAQLAEIKAMLAAQGAPATAPAPTPVEKAADDLASAIDEEKTPEPPKPPHYAPVARRR